MKHMALAVVLACVLSGIAQAGEIHSTDRTTPPAPSSTVAPGEIPSSDRSLFREMPSTGATTAVTIILTLIGFGR